MNIGHRLVERSISRPKAVVLLMVLVALALATLVPAVKVDTDPENMLGEDEAVRVFHHRMRRLFDLHDIVVLGVINEENPDGVFNPDSLKKIHELTELANTLQFPIGEPGQATVAKLLARRYRRLGRMLTRSEDTAAEEVAYGGVISRDIIAPSKVNTIMPLADGGVDINTLMREPPETREQALAVRDRARRNPMLNGTLISEDGKALCIYLPLTSKDLSHNVYVKLREKIAGFSGPERYYITGLPVAEDTFGVEMFKQMAISAPIAMAVIFLLMLLFFRKLALVISPMIVAMVSVICTMGLLIGSGSTVHIMSSMIPIFIMPIAVLDSIHILSEFFDRYRATRDRRTTIVKVMDELFMPMLYTSLTSAAGFASLALTPIPPVQTFGIFVALGVMLAWGLTVTFIPAYIMLIKEKTLANFGGTHHEHDQPHGRMARFLSGLGRFTYRRAKPILVVTLIVAAAAGYGISRININDNPVKWFSPSHPIRVADRELNAHFGGTYMAYLALDAEILPQKAADFMPGLARRMDSRLPLLINRTGEQVSNVFAEIKSLAASTIVEGMSGQELVTRLREHATTQKNKAEAGEDDDAFYAWEEAEVLLSVELQRLKEPAKWPEFLRYLRRLQDHMATIVPRRQSAAGPDADDERRLGLVGKTNSIADAVKAVHRDFYADRPEMDKIPESFDAVGQMIMQFDNSSRPQDTYHLVTKDFTRASIWIQLRSGDNQDMEWVIEEVDRYVSANPIAAPLKVGHAWYGLTYINVVWQGKMVNGMLMAFLGSFLVVFLMMTVLFRSALWGILSMIPLTVTIALIYGLVGLLGIDYNMPIAVLSSLTLGLAVDFAIHFLARSRRMVAEIGSWDKAAGSVFGEPARAITRNVIVIAVGFLPLVFAPLMPYKTVGFFLATILIVSGAGTLIILPALIRLLKRLLFAERKHPMACYCGTCIISGLAALVLVVVNVWQYLNVGISRLTWISLAAVPVLFLACCLMSRRESCAAKAGLEENQDD